MENQIVEVQVQTGRFVIQAHPKHKGLVGREVEVTKASKKPGYVNGHLVDTKKGGVLQKTEIAILSEALVPLVGPAQNLEQVV